MTELVGKLCCEGRTMALKAGCHVRATNDDDDVDDDNNRLILFVLHDSESLVFGVVLNI